MGIDSEGNTSRVLYLEDSKVDADLVKETLLSSGMIHSIEIACNKNEYLSLLEKNQYDIILADYKLPSFDAPEALKIAKEMYPELPFICISGVIGEETAVEFLKMGATDYLLKDRIQRLPAAIERAIEEAKQLETNNRINLAIKETSVLFESIINTTPGMIWMAGLDMTRNWFNKAWLSFRGKLETTEQFDGWFEGLHKDDTDRVKAKYINAFRTKCSYNLEYRLQRSDGQYRWIFEEGHPRYSASNEFVGFIGACTDVTNQKMGEIRIGKLKSVHTVLRNILTVLTSDFSIEDKRLQIFETAVNLDSVALSFLIEKDEDRTSFKVISANENKKNGSEYISECLFRQDFQSNCPMAKVFRSNKHEICNYLKDDDAFMDCKNLAVDLGIRSVSVFPIHKKGEIIAAYVICSEDASYFDKDTTKMFDELSKNISQAITYTTRK
jgi:PAS domain S-box-containing protein